MIPLSSWLSDTAEKPPRREPAAEPAAVVDLDVEALLAERYEAGIRQGREAALLEAEAMMAEHEARFERDRAVIRQEWAATEAEVLATLCRDAIASVRSALEADLATALKPFIAGRVVEQSLNAFRGALAGQLEARSAASVCLSLPEEFRTQLEPLLAASGGIAGSRITDGGECSASIGDMSFETCIGEWLAMMEGRQGD